MGMKMPTSKVVLRIRLDNEYQQLQFGGLDTLQALSLLRTYI